MSLTDFETGAASPLAACEFDAAMSLLGPFEERPVVAVGVSGGADSMALCRLAADWARARGGSAVALTVDHGLRGGSAAEAELARAWLADLGIEHEILPWLDPKPTAAIQERARRARYALLTAWCRGAGVLHLLLAHHRRDQAETVAIRRGRGSGEAGLAAMAGVVETASVRLLRPLLKVPPERLRALLRAQGHSWIEDPANRDMRFARTAVRRALAGESMTEAALARLAARMARTRVMYDRAAAEFLARWAVVHPAGFVAVDGSAFAAAPRRVAAAVLRNVIGCVGGRAHPANRTKVEELLDRVVIGRSPLVHNPGRNSGGKGERNQGRGTLGGCRVLSREGKILVCRESRNLPRPVPAVDGLQLHWDGRFLIRLAATGRDDGPRVWLRPIGGERGRPPLFASSGRPRHPVPPEALAALPALVDEQHGVVAVPHLGIRRGGLDHGVDFATAAFRPLNPVAGAGCFLAYDIAQIMS